MSKHKEDEEDLSYCTMKEYYEDKTYDKIIESFRNIF